MWKIKKYENEKTTSPEELSLMIKSNRIEKNICLNVSEYEIKFLSKLKNLNLTLLVTSINDILRLLRVKNANLNFGKMIVSPYSMLEIPSQERVKNTKLFELIQDFRFDLNKIVNVLNVNFLSKLEKYDDFIDRKMMNYGLFYSPYTFPKIKERKERIELKI